MNRFIKKLGAMLNAAALIVLSLFIQTACAPEKEINLYDFRNAVIPADTYVASESDIDVAVGFMLMEKEVLVTKKENGGMAEEGDVVEASCRNHSGDIETITIFLGSGNEPSLEEAVMGKLAGADAPVLNSDSWSNAHVNSVKCFAEELTEAIAKKYFGGKSISDIRDEVRDDIEAHRRYEYLVSAISENSEVKGYDREMKQYVAQVCSILTTHLSAEGITLSEYVNEVYGMSVSGYKNAIKENYRNYLIFKEVIDNEELTVTEELYSSCLNDYAEAWNLSTEEAEELYGSEYIYLQVCLDLLYEAIEQTNTLE